MTKIDPSLFLSGGDSVRHAFGDCPECGSALHILNSKKGKFLGCTSYPDCHYSQPLQKQNAVVTLKVMEVSECPECCAELAVKKGRYGMFIGCTNFPECHHISTKQESPAQQQQAEEDKVKCPSCKSGHIVKRSNKSGKTFYSCDRYPKCKYLVNNKPVQQNCPECGSIVLLTKPGQPKKLLYCPNRSCNYEQEAAD